mgnify:CR=1 FL=1|tara:strand:+ start:19866 stop:20057 length:192 start_codon:yes stop_codon:yes gene_type:complete
MAIEIFDVSITLSRDNSNDDDETWVDEQHIANEIKSWLEDIDYGVMAIGVNNIKINYGETNAS